MHTHRVHVFNGTDNNGVVGLVAHHFHLEFFPAQQAFIDQDLVHRARIQAGFAEMLIIIAVIGHTATGAAHGKGGANDGRQADVFQRGHTFIHRGGDRGTRVFDAQAIHSLAKQLAVLGHFNGFTFRADHFNAVFRQHTHFF